MNIGIEKTDIHKGVTVKALLDSGTIEMFMDRKMVVRHGFKLQKLEKPVVVRNIDGTNNSAGAITYQVEVNVYYKNHMEIMRMDICNLERTEVILGMPWLQMHNLEINWKIGKIKMMRCLPLCRRNTKKIEDRKAEKRRRIATIEEEKIVRWAVDDKKDWRREKEVEADYRKIEEMVPKKVFKVEEGILEGRIRKNANQKDLGSCYRSQGDI